MTRSTSVSGATQPQRGLPEARSRSRSTHPAHSPTKVPATTTMVRSVTAVLTNAVDDSPDGIRRRTVLMSPEVRRTVNPRKRRKRGSGSRNSGPERPGGSSARIAVSDTAEYGQH